MKRWLIWMIVFCVWLVGSGFSSGAVHIYSMAAEFAQAGQKDFAFMHFNELLRDYPESRYREQALFATGEYYFRIYNYQGAEAAFKTFLEEYPDAKERLYTLAYLLSLARRNQDKGAVEELEKQIIELQQVSFVFRETKEITYRSPLAQNYKAVIHIDKIEFYVEGKLFANVSF